MVSNPNLNVVVKAANAPTARYMRSVLSIYIALSSKGRVANKRNNPIVTKIPIDSRAKNIEFNLVISGGMSRLVDSITIYCQSTSVL